jgi:hypothetical protein
MLGQRLRSTFDYNKFHIHCYFIMGVYIGINALFALLYFLSPESVSFLFSAINAIAPNFPIIMIPTEWLLKNGNPERATMVLYIYGFGWLSFIFLTPGFLLTAIYANRKFYERNRDCLNRNSYEISKEFSKKLLIPASIMLLVLYGFFYGAYHDIFQFKGLPCMTQNCVHERNFDLVKVVFFNSFFLMLSFYLLHVAAIGYWVNQYQGRKDFFNS